MLGLTLAYWFVQTSSLGNGSRWADWSTVVKAYIGLCDLVPGQALPRVEGAAVDEINADLEQDEVEASRGLYYMLTLLMRNEALNIFVNVGAGEGLDAWRRLVQRCDSLAATRLVGLLLALMNWSFMGDIQGRSVVFARGLLRYEKRAQESVGLSLRSGMVLNGLDRGALKDDMRLNSSRDASWVEFKEGTTKYRRAPGFPPRAISQWRCTSALWPAARSAGVLRPTISCVTLAARRVATSAIVVSREEAAEEVPARSQPGKEKATAGVLPMRWSGPHEGPVHAEACELRRVRGRGRPWRRIRAVGRGPGRRGLGLVRQRAALRDAEPDGLRKECSAGFRRRQLRGGAGDAETRAVVGT